MYVIYKSWYKKGIIVINDLLENDGNFLSFNSFKVKFDVTVLIFFFFFLYNSLVFAKQLNLGIIYRLPLIKWNNL